VSRSKLFILAAAVSFAMLFDCSSVRALAVEPVEIRFQNHQFTPSSLTVPAGQKLSIKVINASDETIEFESFKLNREKVVSPGETITVRLPELSPGDYDFYDDFHQDVPVGNIVAR